MFEEIKEMIDSTIYTNGRGEVTAQNINLAMSGMVDVVGDKFAEVDDAVKAVEDKVTALEQNGSASSGPLRVWVPFEEELVLTEEQMTENADTFAKLFSGYSGLVYMVQQEFFSEEGQSGVLTHTNIAFTYVTGTESGVNVVVLYSSAVSCMLLQDGTVEFL